MRRKTKEISVGDVKIGGNNPVSVQSMTNTDTKDAKATIRQIKRLEKAGCEIVRVSVPDLDSAKALTQIIKATKIPIIADIHFDHRLALKSIDAGVLGLRINPGNIGSKDRVKAICKASKERGISIRIGVNSGSLEKKLLKKHNGVTPEAMVESAIGHIQILEDMDFFDIKLSLKMSGVMETVEAYKLMARTTKYPFHVGITEAGTIYSGTIKSSVGLGILLSQGLGDTIRVSLSGDPVLEVKVGFEILKSLGLRKHGITMISCPTCARQNIDVSKIALKLEKKLEKIEKHLDIAVMGCEVNGPGEAGRCDIGVCGGKNKALIFKNGKIIKKLEKEDIVEEMILEINKLIS